MTGIIDVGGGIRGIYGAGVLDRCLDEKIKFDLCIGVSAGAANIITFAAGQRSRNFRFYHEFAFRKEYMSLDNVFKKGEYFNLDYVYGTLSNSDGECPLDYDALKAFDGSAQFVATEAETGKPVYFSLNDAGVDNYDIISASCSIPVLCKPTVIDGKSYLDGGIADPVPIERAIELGCDKPIIILTKPKTHRKSGFAESRTSKLLRSEFPVSAEMVKNCAQLYNKQVELALELERQGRCLIVAPDSSCGVGTVKKNTASVAALYTKGYDDAGVIAEYLNR